MTSDPKLPFPTEPAVVETSANRAFGVLPATPADEPVRKVEPRRISMFHLWVRRLGVLLFVFLCATLGVMLMIVPWRPEWSDNGLLLPYPVIRELFSSGFVRGVVTGLGLLNVWIGFWEALQYRED